MQRVLIVVSGGAGKSTLSKRMSEETGLPIIHLDSFYWQPKGIPTPDQEWKQKDQSLLEALARNAPTSRRPHALYRDRSAYPISRN
jgi:adenylate kinase family enzyme